MGWVIVPETSKPATDKANVPYPCLLYLFGRLPPLILMIWAAASQQINVSCVLAGCKKETDQPTKTLSLKLLVTFGKC